MSTATWQNRQEAVYFLIIGILLIVVAVLSYKLSTQTTLLSKPQIGLSLPELSMKDFQAFFDGLG